MGRHQKDTKVHMLYVGRSSTALQYLVKYDLKLKRKRARYPIYLYYRHNYMLYIYRLRSMKPVYDVSLVSYLWLPLCY